mgnify:CR=1 FL=1
MRKLREPPPSELKRIPVLEPPVVEPKAVVIDVIDVGTLKCKLLYTPKAKGRGKYSLSCEIEEGEE